MNRIANTGFSVAILSVVVGVASCSSSSGGGSSGTTETTTAKVDHSRDEVVERLQKSADVLAQFEEKIPADVEKRAQCVVVVPSMAKGGIIVGGQSGKGFASCRTSSGSSGWSAPAPISIAGGTLGAQVGFESTDLVALVTSQNGARGLESGNLRVGADASASAGPVGTGRGASADTSTNSDIVSYSRSKGLFAGAELNGTTIKLDEDATRALYGSAPKMNAILGGSVAAPNTPAATQLDTTIRTGFGGAGTSEKAPAK